MLNKYHPISFTKFSPIRVVAGKFIMHPTRLDAARNIVDNKDRLYTQDEVRRAKRIIIEENK